MKRLLYLTMFLGMGLSLFGQSKVGTAGMMFLDVTPSARAAGMGTAFVAVANDASALYYNPAGIAWMSNKGSVASMVKLPADINIAYGGFVFPLSNIMGNVGISFTSLYMNWMKETVPGLNDTAGTQAGWTGNYFTSSAYALQLTYAKKFTDKFSSGVNLKFVSSTLYPGYSTYVVSGDVGTFYDTKVKTLKIGMIMSNFGSEAEYVSESFPLPMSFRVGISAMPYYTGNIKTIVDVEVEHPNHNFQRVNIGTETNVNNILFLRMGYRIADTDFFAETWSAGFGIKLPIGAGNISIDAAYTDMGDLSNYTRYTVNFNF